MNSLTATVLGVSVGTAYLFSRICKKDEFSPWYTKYFNLFRPEYPFQLDYDKGYEKMMEIFKDNFKQGREVGASVTVYCNGNKVVDSYGGYQNFEKKIPFTKNTLSTVYSSTKFMTALVISRLVDQGLLNYNDKVTKYWPEFGKNNKENVTIGDVLRHDAGIPYFKEENPTYDDVKDSTKIRTFLENEEHHFDGKTERAYHAITRGFILNEIVRRVHPKGYSIGMIHENEINLLLNNQFHLGLSKELQDRRSKWYTYPTLDLFSVLFLPKALLGDKKYTFNPKLLDKDSMLSKIMKFKLGYGKNIENSHYFSNLEAPSSNGFTNSNSLAKAAACLANKGSIDGIKLMSENGVLSSINEKVLRFDHVLQMETTMSQGGFGVFKYPEFGERFKDSEFYGWFGAGGSMVVFNLEYNFAFSYVMNAQHFNTFFEGRAHRLFIEAFKVYSETLEIN